MADEHVTQAETAKTPAAEWYVAHTYSGYESKVKTELEKTVANRGMQDLILEVYIPTEKVMEMRADGTKKPVERKLFPGYVLVHMVRTDETWYVVRNTRGVTGFVGPGGDPVPVSHEELVRLGVIKEEKPTKAAAPRVKSKYAIDEMVRLTDEAWKGRAGRIIEINENKQTVRMMVDGIRVETNISNIEKF